MRNSRLRKGAPGEEWSQKARDYNEVLTIRLLRPDDTKAKPWKQQLVEFQELHLASFDFLAAICDSLWQMVGVRPDFYFHDGDLPTDSVPRSLYVTMDFLQYQWRTLWFLRTDRAAVGSNSFLFCMTLQITPHNLS